MRDTYLTGVSVLKEMAAPFMATIKANHVSGKQSPHHGSQSNITCPEQEMGVIRHKCPWITGRLGLRQKRRKSFKEVIAIFVIPEYVSTLYAPDHDVV
jgi:hypothetical protein